MVTSRGGFHFSPWPILLSISAIAMAVGVFVVTQHVQRREAHVNELNRQLLSEQQTLRVLDAEWAYLTRPQRLEELMTMKSERDVMPPVPTPVTNMAPAAPIAPVAAADAAPMPEKVEPAAGPVEKPVIAAIAPKKTVAKVAVKREKPAAPKIAAVKKTSAPKARSYDGAWKPPVKKAPVKSLYVPQRTASHAGVARPIVE